MLTGGIQQQAGFWKSVHSFGKDGIAELERIEKEEKEKWMSKVIVDDLSFKVKNYKKMLMLLNDCLILS